MMGENLVINVKMEAKCLRCGEGGAVNDTGVCLKCLGKRIVKQVRTHKEGRMQITLKFDSLSVKGQIDKEGCFHKQLVAKVTMAYDPGAEAFISGHLMEAMLADIDTKQLEFGG
jgi:hypothetical protein